MEKSVRQGDLGGFAQSENNLSQEGACWLFQNAIAAEDAVVAENAQIRNLAVLRGNTMVVGNAIIRDCSIVEDYAIVTTGVVEGNSRIAGNARIIRNEWTQATPRVADSLVYGEISGNVCLTAGAQVLPGQAFHNPTPDELRITEADRKILRTPERESAQLAPPEGWEPAKKKTRSEPER